MNRMLPSSFESYVIDRKAEIGESWSTYSDKTKSELVEAWQVAYYSDLHAEYIELKIFHDGMTHNEYWAIKNMLKLYSVVGLCKACVKVLFEPLLHTYKQVAKSKLFWSREQKRFLKEAAIYSASKKYYE